MRRLGSLAFVVLGAFMGYLLAGALALAVLIATPITEDDDRLGVVALALGIVLVPAGGLAAGWQLRRAKRR